MEKKEVRQLTLQKLNQLAEEQLLKKQKEQVLLQQLFKSASWQKATTIGVTKSMRLELNTEEIIEKALLAGKIVAVPKIIGPGEMVFIKITSGTIYEESKFGVNEPTKGDILKHNDVSLIIVPGVAFRQDGYRIGFGGGFYDRYLTSYQGETCSLVFTEQLNQNWEKNDYDIPIQTLFTE